MNANFGQVDWLQPVNWDAPLNRGLVSWWLAGEGPFWGGPRFLDLTNRNHGTLTNGPTWNGGVGRPFGMLALTAASSHYVLGSSSVVLPGGSMSIAIWHRSTTNDANFPNLFGTGLGSGTPTSGFALVFQTGSAKASAEVRNGATSVSATPASSIGFDGNWHHHLASYDGSTLLYFVDGAQVASGSGSVGTVTHGTALQVGRRFDATLSRYKTGDFDDGRFWDRALTAADAFAVYLDSATGYQTTQNRIRMPLLNSAAVVGGIRGLITGGTMRDGLLSGGAL